MTNDLTTLADRYAAAKAAYDAAEAALKAVKAEVEAEGRTEIAGTNVILTVTPTERKGFDAKLARTFLTDEQAAACVTVSEFNTIRIKARLTVAA